jgi:hypothetical protein
MYDWILVMEALKFKALTRVKVKAACDKYLSWSRQA